MQIFDTLISRSYGFMKYSDLEYAVCECRLQAVFFTGVRTLQPLRSYFNLSRLRNKNAINFHRMQDESVTIRDCRLTQGIKITAQRCSIGLYRIIITLNFAMYVKYLLFGGVCNLDFNIRCNAQADPSYCPCYVYKMWTTYDAGREKKDLDIIIPCVKEIIFNIL